MSNSKKRRHITEKKCQISGKKQQNLEFNLKIKRKKRQFNVKFKEKQSVF